MLYIVKTQSTFENVYVVEARSETEARSVVMDDDTAPDFVQKHLGERVVDVVKSDEPRTSVAAELSKKGYI